MMAMATFTSSLPKSTVVSSSRGLSKPFWTRAATPPASFRRYFWTELREKSAVSKLENEAESMRRRIKKNKVMSILEMSEGVDPLNLAPTGIQKLQAASCGTALATARGGSQTASPAGDLTDTGDPNAMHFLGELDAGRGGEKKLVVLPSAKFGPLRHRNSLDI